MSRGFKRSDGLLVFTNYDTTNPRHRKSLVIDQAGREVIISIPLERTLTPEKVQEIAKGLILDDAFPLERLLKFEEVNS